MITDMTSFQSIQEQLIQGPDPLIYQKSGYLHNLQSECQFKQTALKTAQNLIQEYHRQNQDLKLQVLRLNQKIQNYQERIQILKQQMQNQQFSSNKNYETQFYNASFKLTNVLEKYSQLQQKYRLLERQLVKYRQYKKQTQRLIQKQKNGKQIQMKHQIQRQFNNFLRTPVNKAPFGQDNAPQTAKKSNFSKVKYSNQINENKSSQEQLNNLKNQKHFQNQQSPNQMKDRRKIGSDFFSRGYSMKKQAESKVENQKKSQNSNKIYESRPYQNNQEILSQKLKILEWKLRQKDEEIMLMLRRNKLIQGKYEMVRQILNKKKEHDEQSDCAFDLINNQKSNKKTTKTYQQHSDSSSFSEKVSSGQKSVKVQKINNDKSPSSQFQKQEKRRFEEQGQRRKKIKVRQPKITKFKYNVNNESTEISNWKNYQN